MGEILLKIEKTVPTTIFELPEIKERVETCFEVCQDQLEERFNEIKAFITSTRDDKRKYDTISYDEIAALFKIYFYESISTKAVEMAFTEESKYDVAANIFELISEESLKEAILGEPMIKAFKHAIRWFGMVSLDSKVALLDKVYLGKE